MAQSFNNDDSQFSMNGLERIQRDNFGDSGTTMTRSRTHRHHGALKAKSDAYADYTNKTLAPEQADFMIQQLERKEDLRLQRTYVNGLPRDEVESWAPVLTVALKFLPGADRAQVNRTEQVNMEGKQADQKDAVWRVTTAGSLLRQFNVSSDLQIDTIDQTALILQKATRHSKEREKSSSDQRRALVSRRQHPHTVTIDSDRVFIVNDLCGGDWDLRGLLIEVDWSSLWDLMVNYRNLIAGGGPEMTFDETRTLLETMIEDARRLCIRSPILFRMSTRACIINSDNTRYGINHGPNFRTLTTSKGIKEIISLSSAYYNSLDPTGSNDSTQKYIRPRFLQMLVLLISLLNNEDLAEIKDFLEATYKIKADRRDIELLILKVIPLLSINPRVFLNALVPAIDGFPLDSAVTKDDDHSRVWDIFVRRILDDDYLLPGTMDDLGRRPLSWVVRWPEDGFKSTEVFNSLQYAGRLRAINDIPPVQVHPGSNSSELTVVFTDDSKYVISPKDLENIIFMTPGVYPVRETSGGRRCFDLLIQETALNDEFYQAIKMTNEIVQRLNLWQTNPKRVNMVNRLYRRRSGYQPFLNDVKGTGRVIEVFATLNQTTLAVTYKQEGRKVSKFDVLENMAREARTLLAFISHIEQRGDLSDYGPFSVEKKELKAALEQVKAKINLAEQNRTGINMNEELSNEPIVKCLYPEGVDTNDLGIWNSYRAWCQKYNGLLQVEANCSAVQLVRWLTSEVIELTLNRSPAKLFVTPLKPVPEGFRHEEVKTGDVAVLLGRYVAIGQYDTRQQGPDEAVRLLNYFRIVSMEEPLQSRRAKNLDLESDGKSYICFA